MAITKAAKVMDARRDSASGSIVLSKEHQTNAASPAPPTSTTSDVYTATSTSRSCDACLYCSDTCGDASCVECDTKLTRLDCSSIANRTCTSRVGCSVVPSYTRCEIRRHNTKDSAWLVVGDTIYDATTYMKQHPGGERSILKKAGGVVDCTMDFQYHSKNGRKTWKKYEVGKVKKCPGCSQNGSSTEDQRQWWMFWL